MPFREQHKKGVGVVQLPGFPFPRSRYSVAQRKLRLTSRFGAVELDLTPRYNVAPTQTAPVALVRDGALTLEDLRWGFEGFNGQSVMNVRSAAG